MLQALSSGIEGQIPENGAVLHDDKLSDNDSNSVSSTLNRILLEFQK